MYTGSGKTNKMKNIITISLLLISCASNQTHPEEAITSTSPGKTIEVTECVDSSGEISKCVSNEDCCPNFVCNFDPEQSRLQKFCTQNR